MNPFVSLAQDNDMLGNQHEKRKDALQKGMRRMLMPAVAPYLVTATGTDSCINMDTRSR